MKLMSVYVGRWPEISGLVADGSALIACGISAQDCWQCECGVRVPTSYPVNPQLDICKHLRAFWANVTEVRTREDA